MKKYDQSRTLNPDKNASIERSIRQLFQTTVILTLQLQRYLKTII